MHQTKSEFKIESKTKSHSPHWLLPNNTTGQSSSRPANPPIDHTIRLSVTLVSRSGGMEARRVGVGCGETRQKTCYEESSVVRGRMWTTRWGTRSRSTRMSSPYTAATASSSSSASACAAAVNLFSQLSPSRRQESHSVALGGPRWQGNVGAEGEMLWPGPKH